MTDHTVDKAALDKLIREAEARVRDHAAQIGGDAAVEVLLRHEPDAGPLKVQMTRQAIANPIRASIMAASPLDRLPEPFSKALDDAIRDEARAEVQRIRAERDAALARVEKLRHQITEASEPDFIWGAMDNVHDAETTLDDYAAAVSRAIRGAMQIKGDDA